MGKTTTLHVHKREFLYISLLSLHDYDVKMPSFTYCRGREPKTTTLFSLLEFSCTKNCQHWRIEQDDKGTSQLWSSTTSLFLSDVFAAIAVVVAIVLIETLRDCDGDGNENVKNTIGKWTTLYGHHAFFFSSFFLHFFAAPAQLRRQMTTLL